MRRAGAGALALLALGGSAIAAPKQPAKGEDGKYFDDAGSPTYNIKPDGTVDWLTYSGYRRYHSECHVCHGPDGMGSSYAPALVSSVESMSYPDFIGVIIQGRENVTGATKNVMPSFGTNNNVACYLDDIYVYLRARGDGALDRVRPAKREAKSQAIADAEKTCLGE